MKTLNDLAPFERQLATESLAWMDPFWDRESGLLAVGPNRMRAVRSVRNTARYALGLLLRNAAGDLERACRSIRAVLAHQYIEPGSMIHGSFAGYPEQPHPGPQPTLFQFDPNHRQFIGTLFVIILDEYSSLLPPDLVRQIDHALYLMVESEPPDRCLPIYTNIALMKAALLTRAGKRYGKPDWVQTGEASGREIHRLFALHGTFEEYNSPTYYGTDLFALAFWRLYSHSGRLATWATEMEATLWREAAPYYHAGLKNMCGPFTRAYGMDMTRYGALMGMLIWMAIGRDNAPFPEAEGLFDHCGDFCWGPAMAIVGTLIPPDVMHHLHTFSGERSIEKRISTQPDRVASAWLSESVMIGAEATPFEPAELTFYRLRKEFQEFDPSSIHWRDRELAAKRCVQVSRDFCPATLHWRQPNGCTGWMRLQHLGAVSAHASPRRLSIAGKVEHELLELYGDAHQSFVFQLCVPGARASIETDCWHLPGLEIRTTGNLAHPEVRQEGDRVTINYHLEIPRPFIEFDIRETVASLS